MQRVHLRNTRWDLNWITALDYDFSFAIRSAWRPLGLVVGSMQSGMSKLRNTGHIRTSKAGQHFELTERLLYGYESHHIMFTDVSFTGSSCTMRMPACI